MDDIAKKTVHNDFWCGYYTLPAIHTFSHLWNGSELKQIALEIKDGADCEASDERITELIRKSGGFQYTLARIDKYADEAKRSLEIFPDSAAKRKLAGLLEDIRLSAHEIAERHERLREMKNVKDGGGQ